MHLEARREHANATFGTRRAGECDRRNRRLRIRVPQSQSPNHLVSVTPWHFDIRYEHVGAFALKRSQRGIGRISRPHLRATVTEDRRDEIARIRIVVNEEDANTVDAFKAPRRRRFCVSAVSRFQSSDR